MHSHPSHLASPQTPHLAPPPLPAPSALKRTRPDSPPRAPPPPQIAVQADGASAETLEAHGAMERNTKKPSPQNAEAAPIRHDLPEDWHSRSKGQKRNGTARENKIGEPRSRPFGRRIGFSLAQIPHTHALNSQQTPPPPRQRRRKHVQAPPPTLKAIFFLVLPSPKKGGEVGWGRAQQQ
jgi:hypothetical protein